MNNTQETWKNVIGYEEIYMVSNMGNVKSLKHNKEKLLKFNLNGGGYHQVDLYKNDTRKMKRVHILVAESFLNHVADKTHNIVVNHIDGNKLNNTLENLELTTQSANVRNGNKCKKSVSKYVGVTWYKQYKKWKSQVYKNKKHYHIGYFDTEEDAFHAIQKWEVEFDENGKLKLV